MVKSSLECEVMREYQTPNILQMIAHAPLIRRWGEEVAIKLIKRGSVQESATRMTKVVREIDVLKVGDAL